MPSVFITGTNRGIGLALVEAYLQQIDMQVFAACRRPDEAESLQKLALANPDTLTLVKLDVLDEASIDAAVARTAQRVEGLDILINNAGVNPPDRSLEAITTETMLYVMNVNSVAPLMIARAFLPLLRRSAHARIVNISSEMGSIAERTYGGEYAYCASKAALNMNTRGLAQDLRADGIAVMALDPGWVLTDMGGAGAHLTPSQSAAGIVKVVEDLNIDTTSQYRIYDGSSWPW